MEPELPPPPFKEPVHPEDFIHEWGGKEIDRGGEKKEKKKSMG